MTSPVSFSKRGAIGIVTVNNQPVNALSQAVRQGIQDCVNEGAADADVTAIIIIGEGRTYMAGADITEFGKPPMDPSLHAVIETIEDTQKPVISAIHGTALGGGLETALACHYRCAVASAKVGLPEVNLGILPGAGGTQRLPRLVGVEKALDMMTTGKPIGAKEALAQGVIDHIVDGDLLDGAVAYAQQVVAEGKPLVRVQDLDDKIAPARGNDDVYDNYRKSVARRTRGFFAPDQIIDCVKDAVNLPFAEGLKMERERFVKCMESPQSSGLMYAFFTERAANKIPDIPKDTPLRDLKKIGIIGCGTMGGGIAMNFASAGIPVTILEMTEEALERGLGIIEGNYAATVKKGRLSQDRMDAAMGNITGTNNYEDLSDVDMVIEAVFEEMDVKHKVFARLDEVCKPGAILATNTSGLDVNEIADGTSRPGDVVGLHFFSPANVMRLLEVVRVAKTEKDVLATVMKMTKSIGKIGVMVGVCEGFVGNRMLGPYLREANFLIEEGATPAQVDAAVFGLGLAMGPFTMSDLAGNDVGWRIRKGKAGERRNDVRYSDVGDRICEQGWFGQKTKRGWYIYEEGSRTPKPDPEVEAIIRQSAEEKGIAQRDITDQEIIERCFYSMVNEGAKILEEGMAIRASDIDVIWLNGYGFPSYRGGPMMWGDTEGLANVVDRLKHYQAEHPGPFWEISPLLIRLAEEGKTFADYDKE